MRHCRYDRRVENEGVDLKLKFQKIPEDSRILSDWRGDWLFGDIGWRGIKGGLHLPKIPTIQSDPIP